MSDQHAIESQTRFRVLRLLALAAAEGQTVEQLTEKALVDSIATLALSAGAVRVFGVDDPQTDRLSVTAGDEEGRTAIERLEQTLLADLRRSYSVRSLYMTLDINGPAGLFSYPLRYSGRVIGAISGIARGERNLAVEEEFVSGIAAMIVLIGRTGEPWSLPPSDETVSPRRISEIKAEAVRETAATINHEINNPLMAVVGNVELLLRRGDRLDADSIGKLERIRDAADRIRNVTQDLVRLRDIKIVDYPGGGRMIDLDNSTKDK